MNKEINNFVERARKLTHVNFDSATGYLGTNNNQSIALDLYKNAAQLSKAKSENKLSDQIDKVVGVLHVAQAMNVIGSDDLLELMELLSKIKDEEK